MGARQLVRVPIFYGRKSRSRGNTFTMSFGAGEPSAQSVLVPCIKKISTIDSLICEANALWQAESPNSKPNTLHNSWGCVGVLFRQDPALAELLADWTAHFYKVQALQTSVVDANGLLGIGWPNTADGKPTNFDVILAAATKPERELPTADVVADAWLTQNDGHETYFFENVRHEIRTPDDLAIWERIERAQPTWLTDESYNQAINILRAERSLIRN